MKLITAIVQDEDVSHLLDSLVKAGFRATKVSSTGGFLRRGNSTVISGVEDHQVDTVIGIVKANCQTRTELASLPAFGGPMEYHMIQPVEVEVGGAVIFVLDMERHLRV